MRTTRPIEQQRALTLVHEIDPAHQEDLVRYLDDLGERVAKQTDLPLHRVETLHFARWVVLPPLCEGGKFLLAFESNHDGDDRAFLEDLVTKARTGIDRIYTCCEGYERESVSGVVSFLMNSETSLPTAAFHIAHRGKSVRSIQGEARLREALEAFLDADRTSGLPQTPLEIRRRAVAHALEHGFGDLPAPVPPLPRWPDPGEWLRDNWPWLGLLWVLLLPVTLPLTLLAFGGYLYLRHLEENVDPNAPGKNASRLPPDLAKLVAREDHKTQNQLTHLVKVKDGRFRNWLLRGVLKVIDVLARHRYNRGDLGGIPSIHFARWLFIDGGERLLFFSNYDGSWESYLGDFIDKAHAGLTGVWSNTVGFPKTKGLIGEGALHEEEFKRWTRNHQVHTNFWYSAYPHLANLEIEINARIRAGLEGDMTEAEARAWLSLFSGGMVRSDASETGGAAEEAGTTGEAATPCAEDPALDLADIQGLVLSGYFPLRHSLFFILRFTDRARTGTWLQHLDVTPVSERRSAVTTNVAFSAAGLRFLGLDDETLETFSFEFREGMGAETRARALGDVGRSAPSQWKWGGPHRPEVHAMVLVYANGAESLAKRSDALRRDLDAAGIEILHEVDAVARTDQKEHFGFVDGLSRTSVRGYEEASDDEKEASDGEDGTTVPAGEFVFGYKNAYDRLPSAPTLAGGDASRLARTAIAADPSCLGQNGSYLVVRDLHQRVADFRTFTRDQARALYPDEDVAGASERIAARCVGRWRDGTPLAVSPDKPQGGANDNLFRYADDPQGYRCPVTAHVRRTNPRDALGPSPERSWLVVNRHRILRRGRVYGDFLEEGRLEDDGKERGLFFMCVNANIARQFEFMQQTWVENPKFGGLSQDTDPLIGGPGKARSTLTMPERPVRARSVGIPSFVDVRGGAYLFLPGLRAIEALAALTAPPAPARVKARQAEAVAE